MTEKSKKYRQKHKRCKYCSHLKETHPNIGCFMWCDAKMKQISTDFPDMTEVPRPFCKCYEI